MGNGVRDKCAVGSSNKGTRTRSAARMSEPGVHNLPGLKKSLKRNSESVSKRIQSQSNNGASPRLAGSEKRKRNNSTTEGSPEDKEEVVILPPKKKMTSSAGASNSNNEIAKALNNIAMKFDAVENQLKQCSKKEDIQKLEQNLMAKVEENTNRIEKIEQRSADNQKRIEALLRAGASGGPANERDAFSEVEKTQYWEARRLMRMWPVPNGGRCGQREVDDFMKKYLDIPENVRQTVTVSSVRPLGQMRRSKIQHEVLVKFERVDDRDTVQSYAPNLAAHKGQAEVRMEVPTHLKPAFRTLEGHARELSSRYPAMKKSIKFDDATLGIVMDVRLTEGSGWQRIDEKKARESKRIRGELEQQNNKACPGGKEGRKALMLPSPPGMAFEGIDQGGSNSSKAEYHDTEGFGGTQWRSAASQED